MGGRDNQISKSSRPAWSTERLQGQSGLLGETLSPKTKKKRKKKSFNITCFKKSRGFYPKQVKTSSVGVLCKVLFFRIPRHLRRRQTDGHRDYVGVSQRSCRQGSIDVTGEPAGAFCSSRAENVDSSCVQNLQCRHLRSLKFQVLRTKDLKVWVFDGRHLWF